jgi:hypothetical protein
MIRRHERFARARYFNTGDIDLSFVIDVIEVEKRKDGRVRPLPPEVHTEINRLELLAQYRRCEPAAPFIEIAEHNLRYANPPIVNDGGQPVRLILAFTECGAEMHIEQMKRVVVDR